MYDSFKNQQTAIDLMYLVDAYNYYELLSHDDKLNLDFIKRYYEIVYGGQVFAAMDSIRRRGQDLRIAKDNESLGVMNAKE